MADKTVIVEIQYDTGQAVKNIENLTSVIEGEKVMQAQLKSELERGQISQKKYSEEIAKSKEETSKANKERNNTIKLLGTEKGSIDEVKARIKQLDIENGKLNRTTKEGNLQFQKNNKEIKLLNKNLKESKKDTGEATGAFGKFKNNLASIPGPIGGVIKGIGGMTKAALAFIATPLGIVIAAITAGLLAVKAAFTGSEEGQNKFAKIMAVINTILGNFQDLLADLGDKIIAVFENPKQSLKDFAAAIKKNISNRFEGLLELIPKLGKAISLLFKGEFKESGKVAANAIAKVALGVEDFTDKIQIAIDKTKEFVAENIKEAKLSAQVADMRAKSDILERKLLVERAKLESRIAELRLNAREEDRFTAEQRKKFLQEARDLQDGLLSKEKEVLELRRDAQILENTFSRTNKENKTKEAEATAAVFKKETERFNQTRTIQRELIRVDGQIEREKKAAQAAEKKRADGREKLMQAELEKRAEAIEKIAEIEYTRVINEAKTIEDIKALQTKKANDELKAKLENEEISFEEIQALKDELSEEELEIELERRGVLFEEYELAEAEHKARLSEIDKQYNEEIAAHREGNLQDAFSSMQKIISATSGMADKRVSIISDAFSKIATINFKELKSSKDKFVAIASAASGLTSLITSNHEQESADLAAQQAYQLSLVEGNTEATAAINEQFARKSAQLKTKQAKEDKTAAIIDATISTALGVVSALANSGNPILGIVMAALVGALGGFQIASIASQPTPKFSYAKGGIIGGKPHSQGGTKFYGEDGNVFEAERDEAMFVLKKDATAEIAALSAVNESFGGRSFISRPSSHLQDGGQADTTGVNIQNAVADELQRTPIIVKVSDIETGMTEVDNVKNVGVI